MFEFKPWGLTTQRTKEVSLEFRQVQSCKPLESQSQKQQLQSSWQAYLWQVSLSIGVDVHSMYVAHWMCVDLFCTVHVRTGLKVMFKSDCSNMNDMQLSSMTVRPVDCNARYASHNCICKLVDRGDDALRFCFNQECPASVMLLPSLIFRVLFPFANQLRWAADSTRNRYPIDFWNPHGRSRLCFVYNSHE